MLRITYKQISDEEKFDLFASHFRIKAWHSQNPPSNGMAGCEVLKAINVTDWSVLDG